MSENIRKTRKDVEYMQPPYLIYSTPHNFRRRILGVLRKIEVLKMYQGIQSCGGQKLADEIDAKIQMAVQAFREINADCLRITILEKRYKVNRLRRNIRIAKMQPPSVDIEDQDVNVVDDECEISNNFSTNITTNTTFTEKNVELVSEDTASTEAETGTQGQASSYQQDNNSYFDMNDLDDIDEIIRNNINIDKREFGLLMNSISYNSFSDIPTEGCVELENINVVPLE